MAPESPPPDEPAATGAVVSQPPTEKPETIGSFCTHASGGNALPDSAALTTPTFSQEPLTSTGSDTRKRTLDGVTLPGKKRRPGRPAKTRALDFYKVSSKPFAKKAENDQARGKETHYIRL
jgi:hypothetical protein